MPNSFNTKHNTANSEQPSSPGSGSDAMSTRLPESWAHSLFFEPMAQRATSHDNVSLNVGVSSAAVAGLRQEVDVIKDAMQRLRYQIHHLTDQLVQTNIQVQQAKGEYSMEDFRCNKPDQVESHQFEQHQLAQKRQHQHPTAAVALAPRQDESSAQRQNRMPEPATQSSTYVVRKRSRSNLFDRLTRSVPFSVLMVIFGITLAAVVALASPSLVIWMGISELIAILLRVLFVTIAFSSAIAVILELCQ